MAFTVAGAALDPHNGLATDGLTCDAFNEETWFPSSSPVANTAEPGSPDGTDTSGLTGNSGVAGQFLITVPTSGSYWIATYNNWDPTVINWIKAITHPHTNLQGWTAAVDQTGVKTFKLTTIAAGSNGVALPTGTINVASTTGFPSSGFLLIYFPGAETIVRYTGTAGGNQFTGCTGGSGTLTTGKHVNSMYQNGSYRRLAMIDVGYSVSANGDQAIVVYYSVIAGSLHIVAEDGIIAATPGPNTVTVSSCTPVPVDPLGYYGGQLNISGTGVIGTPRWVEVDF